MLCACVCARNALETVASQHEVELQQARQQAVDEYRAKALSETADLSDASVLADQQATSAVSDLFCIHFSSPYCIGLQYIIMVKLRENVDMLKADIKKWLCLKHMCIIA